MKPGSQCSPREKSLLTDEQFDKAVQQTIEALEKGAKLFGDCPAGWREKEASEQMRRLRWHLFDEIRLRQSWQEQCAIWNERACKAESAQSEIDATSRVETMTADLTPAMIEAGATELVNVEPDIGVFAAGGLVAPSDNNLERPDEWLAHLDLHVTEHDLRHAGLALRAAWPAVSEYILLLERELNAARSATGDTTKEKT